MSGCGAVGGLASREHRGLQTYHLLCLLCGARVNPLSNSLITWLLLKVSREQKIKKILGSENFLVWMTIKDHYDLTCKYVMCFQVCVKVINHKDTETGFCFLIAAP